VIILASAEPTKRKQSGGEALLVFFSIFALAVSLLVVSVRLLQQPVEGMHPTSLLVLSILGILGSVAGMVSNARRSSQPPAVEVAPPPPPALETEEKPEQTLPRVRLGKYVQTLEEQLQTLRLENQTIKDEIGQLRSKESDWQKRSLEMFRLLDKMRRNESPGDVLSAKKHFTQLVAPLGIGVIEPEPGDPFDEKLHQAENLPEDLPEQLVVAECLEWGYTINGQVNTPAKVTVAAAE
jgi:molecular chaperone GrpE (heat shock protein)